MLRRKAQWLSSPRRWPTSGPRTRLMSTPSRQATCARTTQWSCSATKPETARSWNVFRQGAGASLKTLRALPYSSARPPVTMSMAMFWWGMAGGWGVKHVYGQREGGQAVVTEPVRASTELDLSSASSVGTHILQAVTHYRWMICGLLFLAP